MVSNDPDVGPDSPIDLNAAIRYLMRTGVVGVIAGEEDRVTLANDRFLEMVGYHRADLADGIDWVALTPPEWVAQDVASIELLQEQGHAGPLRKEYLHCDGTRVPVLIGGALVSRHPFRWCSVVVDLSAETEARRSADSIDALWQAVTAELPIGLAVFDRDARFVRINPTLAAINRIEVEAHLGRSLDEVIPPPHGMELREIVETVFDTGRRVDIPRYVATDWRTGATATSMVSYFPVRDTAGGVVAAACAVLDLTAQVEMEQRLLSEQRRRQALIDGLFSFVGYLDPVGVLLDANRTALDAAGLTLGDVVGKPFPDTYWWAHDPDVQLRLRAAIRDGRSGVVARYDEQVRVKHGNLITIDFQLVPVIEGDRVVGMVVSGMDVSERIASSRRAAALTDLGRALTRASTLRDVALEAVGDQSLAALEADRLRLWKVGPEGPSAPLADPGGDGPGGVGPSEAALDAWRTGVLSVRSVSGERSMLADTSCEMAVRIAYAGGGAVLEGVWRHPVDVSSLMLRNQIEAAAELIGQALGRAAASAVRDELVRELQHQALGDVASVEGLSIAVRYVAATAAIGFGGDWYDVIDLADGRVAVIVGDVIGHGAKAAASMSKVRGMLHAALHARPSASLGGLLADVSQWLTGHDPRYVGTAALALIDRRERTVSVLSAGHPPVVRVSATGITSLVPEARTSPLGMASPVTSIPVTDLSAGDSVVLYTDGLVESRGRSWDDGLGLLRSSIEGEMPATADALADLLLDRLVPTRESLLDDTVVAVVRIL